MGGSSGEYDGQDGQDSDGGRRGKVSDGMVRCRRDVGSVSIILIAYSSRLTTMAFFRSNPHTASLTIGQPSIVISK